MRARAVRVVLTDKSGIAVEEALAPNDAVAHTTPG